MRFLFFFLASLNILAMDRDQALAAQTYYFSDCATGGAGTITNPYCLRPGTSSTNVSVDYLFDGVGSSALRTEAAAGDLIYLCCGGVDGCEDGTTSCTYDMAAVIQPSGVNQNMFNPRVTIRNYGNDRPELSGEMSNLSSIFRLRDNQGGFTFSGFVMKRATSKLIDIDCNQNSCGNVTFSGMQIKEANACAWGDIDGVGNNTGCLPDSQGGFLFFMLGLGYDFTVIDSVISEGGGMGIRHLMSDESFSTAANVRDYNVLWARNTFRNIAQIANIWQTYDWKVQRGARIIFRQNTFEGWRGSLGLEQRNRGALFEDNTFICSSTYNMSFGYSHDTCAPEAGGSCSFTTGLCVGGPRAGSQCAMSECQAAISVSEGDYGSERRGGNAGHIFRRNKIYGAHLGANRATEKDEPGWLPTGIVWEDSCIDTSKCMGLGDPWCCCTGVGVGPSCNTTTSGGNCVNDWFKYGCVAGAQYGNQIENNMIYAAYDCGIPGSGCSGPADDANSTGIYVNTNSPVYINNNTVYSNDYGLVVDNSYGNTTIHTVTANILSTSAVREMKDKAASSIPAAEVADNNIYSGSHSPYEANSVAVICNDVDTLGNGTNVCLAPQFNDTSGGTSAWDLHIKALPPDYNVLISGPDLDFENDPRPLDPTGISTTKFDRGADEVRPTGLFIEWGQTTSNTGSDQHCGPFGAPDDNTTFRPFYHNYGPGDATNVKLVFSWTDDATYVSTTCPSCVNVGDLLTCTVGTVPALGGAECNIVLACPSILPRHALQIGADISSDNRGICATDEQILGCGNFPSPTTTQGLP